MPGSALIVVAYIALAVFAVVFVMRTVSLARLPVHLRWELAPVPHEKGKSRYGGSYFEEYEWWTKPREKSLVSELVYMFKEIAFLKGVWEHNRRLWWWSFPFHFGMYLLIAAVPVLLLGTMLRGLGGSVESVGASAAVSVLTGGGFALGGVGAIGLLASRLFDGRLKPFTTPASLFNLALLLAVFASGGWAMVAPGAFPAGVSGFLTALLTADLTVAPSGAMGVHLLFACLFLAYLPFSQMMHFVAKYFTYHQVRWDDRPMAVGGPMEKEVLRLLGQTVTWSGPHLGADGKKNWVDIASGGEGQ